MTISELLLKYQLNHDFEDTVLKFVHLVQSEEEVPLEVYTTLWEFTDNSTILLQNEKFCSIIDTTEQ